MSANKRYYFLLIFIGFSVAALGQAASSPFSTFGIGEPFGNSLIQNQGMGGIGVSNPQYWSINNQNPALLRYNYMTSFQSGAMAESRTISSDTLSQRNVSGNLNYLVIAFPVKVDKWTTSFGLMPYTKVNYKLQYTEEILENGTGNVIDTTNVFEQGTGGLSQFYWANGIRIHENWSIGVKATYLFGSINTDYSNYAGSDNNNPFFVRIKEQTYVKDFAFSGGLSFSKDSLWNKDYRFSFGVIYNFAANLNANKTSFIQRTFSSTPITSDTVVQKGGSIFLPGSMTMGISFGRGPQWNIASEVSFQDWTKFTSINKDDEGLQKAWKVSLGGEFMPDALSKNYLMRITYRTGASYEKVPFLVNNNPLKDFGINFGLSLPANRSSLDIAFRVGKRGNKSENVLEETYYKIYFGITFNDRWFIKSKFD